MENLETQIRNNEEQIVKKIKSWGRTRQIKIAQAKRFEQINTMLKFRMLVIYCIVVIIAVASLLNPTLAFVALIYAILTIFIQNYVNQLGLDISLNNFRALEVNLDSLINEMEKNYRNICKNPNTMNFTETNDTIQSLTDRYNSSLRNIPLHDVVDYNRYKRDVNSHIEDEFQEIEPYELCEFTNIIYFLNLFIIAGFLVMVLSVFL